MAVLLEDGYPVLKQRREVVRIKHMRIIGFGLVFRLFSGLAVANTLPNIVVILADDLLGEWTELGNPVDAIGDFTRADRKAAKKAAKKAYRNATDTTAEPKTIGMVF